MDRKEASRIVRVLFDKESRTFLSKEDKFQLKEALQYLSEVEHDPRAMATLGGIYYEEENYPLAEKYYLSSYEAGNKEIASGLGFIYFYGRTGTPDYQKAMRYFSEAADNGDLEAAMKIADMYRDGLGVKADKDEYEKRVRSLYDEAIMDDNVFAPVPELAHRLAAIDIEKGNEEEAKYVLKKGRLYITTRIRYNAFWGNFIVARRIEALMDKLGMIDHRMPNFFDLLQLLKTPSEFVLIYGGEQHHISSFADEGKIRVKFDDKAYSSIEDFFRKAGIKGRPVYMLEYYGDYSLIRCGNE